MSAIDTLILGIELPSAVVDGDPSKLPRMTGKPSLPVPTTTISHKPRSSGCIHLLYASVTNFIPESHPHALLPIEVVGYGQLKWKLLLARLCMLTFCSVTASF
jgi:hypothetical protein